MSDTDATASDTDSVVQFGFSDWYGRRELADRLDVSLRTIDRRVNGGEIEKRTTPNGKLYRPVSDEADRQEATAERQQTTLKRQQSDTDTTTVGDSKTTPEVSQGVADLVALVRDQTDRIAELERKVGRLQERVNSQQAQNTGTAETESDETSEAANEGCDMTAKEMVDLLRSTAKDDSSS